ncbi:MAG: putative sugar O-methyltransferase [Proteobacteria bacterium]|nr:putative sugar O-methyltransferase [Pseudomonadota bacterium]
MINDDPELLALMLADTKAAPVLYRPTNYWKVYEEQFMSELAQMGLRDFRRRRNSVLQSFGASDLREPLVTFDLRRLRYVNNRVFRRIPRWETLLARLSAWLAGAVAVRDDLGVEGLQRLAISVCEDAATPVPSARPVSDLEMSIEGGPEEVFEYHGRTYSIPFLSYYLRYVFASRFIDLETIAIFAELGVGLGRQVEVIHKLHPRVTILAFDIPPQLYVAHQYLSAVFPDDVLDYRDTRLLVGLTGLAPGKIYILGAWQFPQIATISVDLFWNAGSFQEMEPEVVGNYLGLVRGSVGAVFLQQLMEGKEVAARPGVHGVLAPTTFEHYRRFLEGFDLVHMEPSLTVTGGRHQYKDSFWRKRKKR